MSDQGGAGEMRETGGAVRMMVSGGPEGGRSQGRPDLSTGRSGALGSEAGGQARGSSGLSEAGVLKN